MPQVEYTGRVHWFGWAAIAFPTAGEGQQVRISSDEKRVTLELLEGGEPIDSRELSVEDFIDIFFGED